MSRLSKHIIDIAVFGCGAVVMIYEIVGSRVIAPYIGTSTYTWTSLIGVILAALSLGYWLGGRWADKGPKMSVLAGVIFFAGAMVSVTILIKEPVLAVLSGAGLPIEIAAVLSALVLFAPASVLLGFVSPYAVRLSVESIAHAGRTIGRLYALSTVGSIAGTFFAGFFLIPFVGTNRTLYLLAIVLFLISISIVPMARTNARIAALVILFFAIAFGEGQALVLRSANNYHDIDTQYNRVRIFDTEKDGRPLRAMMIDPYIYQSSVYLDTRESGAAYMRFYELAFDFSPELSRALLIGGAGYGFPRGFVKMSERATIDVVEIDPAMTALARRHFFLRDHPRIRPIHADGRIFLNQAGQDIYDAIFLDAFNSLFSIPFHLTTIEAVEMMRKALKRDGVVLVNIGTALEGEGSRFLDAEAATYRAVFDYVEIYRVDASKPRGQIQNVILAASSRPIVSRSGDQSRAGMLDNAETMERPSASVLTDDLAPVERMLSVAQSRYSEKR